jgi:hypothetical protein
VSRRDSRRGGVTKGHGSGLPLPSPSSSVPQGWYVQCALVPAAVFPPPPPGTFLNSPVVSRNIFSHNTYGAHKLKGINHRIEGLAEEYSYSQVLYEVALYLKNHSKPSIRRLSSSARRLSSCMSNSSCAPGGAFSPNSHQ